MNKGTRRIVSAPIRVKSDPIYEESGDESDATEEQESEPEQVTAPQVVFMKAHTRRLPHCRQCGRRKLGHPQSGCPYVTSASAPPQMQAPKTTKAVKSEPRPVAVEPLPAPDFPTAKSGRRSLPSRPTVKREPIDDYAPLSHLSPRNHSPPSNRAPPHPSESISSVSDLTPSYVSREMVSPNYSPTPGRSSRTVKREPLDDVSSLTRAAPRDRPSPSTGWVYPDTPTSGAHSRSRSTAPLDGKGSSKYQSPPPSRSSRNNEPARSSPSSHRRAERMEPTPHPERSIPSTRSAMSLAMARNAFVTKLSELSGISIHIVPKAAVEDIVQQAENLGFIVHYSVSDNPNDDTALVVLGTNEVAVASLLDRVTRQSPELKSKSQSTDARMRRVPTTSPGLHSQARNVFPGPARYNNFSISAS